MYQFRKALAEVMTSVVIGIALTAIIISLSEDGVLPSYSPIIFAIVSFIVNLSLINSLQKSGISYTLGWLFGALLLKESLELVDAIFNIGCPILVLILRAWFAYKSTQQ